MRLPDLLAAVAAGEQLPADGAVRVLPSPCGRDAGVLAFTGHSVVVGDVPPEWVYERLPADDLSAPLGPPFLTALAQRYGRGIGNLDALLVAPAEPVPADVPLRETAPTEHPRVARSLRYRDEVRLWVTEGALVLLGRGVAGRWEVAVEVDGSHRGRGLGRTLASAARALVPGQAPLWAQVAPGNAASMRAFLAAGYRPVGAECLLSPR